MSGKAQRLRSALLARTAELQELFAARDALLRADEALQRDCEGLMSALDRQQAEIDALKAQLAAAIKILLDNADCSGCEAGEPLWVQADHPELLLHGGGEDVCECESNATREAVDAGLIAPQVVAKCECCHGWYGEGCPECAEEKEAQR